MAMACCCSNDQHERLGGVLAIDELIDVKVGSRCMLQHVILPDPHRMYSWRASHLPGAVTCCIHSALHFYQLLGIFAAAPGNNL